MRTWWRARRTRTKVLLVVAGVLLVSAIASSGSKPTTSSAPTATASVAAVANASAAAVRLRELGYEEMVQR